MTIICTMRDKASGRMLLGGNSRALVCDTVLPSDQSKWLKVGDWAIALTGRGLMNDTVAARVDDWPDTENIFVVTKALFSWFRDAEIGKEEEGAMDFDTSGIIVHRDGRVWDLDTRLSVAPINADAFWAGGSGMEYALGAAQVLSPLDLTPTEIMTRAMEAAIALDSGCPGSAMIEEF